MNKFVCVFLLSAVLAVELTAATPARHARDEEAGSEGGGESSGGMGGIPTSMPDMNGMMEIFTNLMGGMGGSRAAGRDPISDGMGSLMGSMPTMGALPQFPFFPFRTTRSEAEVTEVTQDVTITISPEVGDK